MLSARYLIVRKGMEKQKADPSTSVEAMRNHMARLARLFPAPEGTLHESCTIGQVPCEWVTTKETTPKAPPIILYFHGGGYVAGNPASHRHLVSRLCSASRTRALVVDYPLAPENLFPAQLEAALAVYDHLVTHGSTHDSWPQQIVVAGDSAGGGLAISTLIAARDRGLPMPAAALTMSGWFDCTGTSKSTTERAQDDPILWPETIHRLANYFLGGQEKTHPHASPLFADLAGLPPLMLQVGTDEILFDDTISLAEKARAAGVDVQLDIGEKLFHVWQFMARVLPEGAQAIERAGKFVMDSVKKGSLV